MSSLSAVRRDRRGPLLLVQRDNCQRERAITSVAWVVILGLALLISACDPETRESTPAGDPLSEDAGGSTGRETIGGMSGEMSSATGGATGGVTGGTTGGDTGGDTGGVVAINPDALSVSLSVTSDSARDLRDAIARSGVPIAQAYQLMDVTRLVLLDETGRRVPAQFQPLARWGGVMDDTSLPIRWLEVTLVDDFSRQQTQNYQLTQLEQASSATPDDLTVTEEGQGYWVNTGELVVLINPANPALIDQVDRGGETLYEHQAGAGPQLTLSGSSTLGTHDLSTISVDAGSFRVLKRGPLQASFALQGHWIDPLGLSRCDLSAENPDYESLGFTVVITLTYGQPHLDIELQARNECGNLFNSGVPWEGSVSVDQISWSLPLSLGAEPTLHYASSGTLSRTTDSARVEQRRGGGTPWMRQMRVSAAGEVVEEGEALSAPCVGASGRVTALAQLPWMRFREPQALSARADHGLTLELVSEPIVVGATKGLWYRSRVSLLPAGVSSETLDDLCSHNLAHLERGLLVRAALSDLNQAQLFPSLGDSSSSAIKSAYIETIDRLHDSMLGAQGQLARYRTYGAQLWPDSQFSSYPDEELVGGPSQNPGSMNYWNPSRVELYEFLRTGDPKWAWDFALPATWLHLFTTYGNAGEHAHGNRNGFALNSGACPEEGCEDGQWHRYAFGSDDYTYTIGNLAYAIQPSYPLYRRFAIAGRTVQNRYALPQANEELRERYVDQIDLTRQVIQHVAQLANCAEFVGGAEGRACHERLIELVTELAQDQLSSGLMCIGDLQRPDARPCQPDPSVEPDANWCDCISPQQFMNNSLIYPFLLRMYLNYGDLGGALYRGLTQSVWHTYRSALGIPSELLPDRPQDPDRPAIPVEGDWLGQPGWDRDTEPYQVVDVDVFDDDPQTQDPFGNEANLLLWPNKAQQVALFMIAHSLDPELNLCAVSRAALDDTALPSFWSDYGLDSGWSKGSAQMMQSVVFGVGLYDTCD